MKNIKITISGTGNKTTLAAFVLGHLRAAGFQSGLTDKAPDNTVEKWGDIVRNTIVAVEVEQVEVSVAPVDLKPEPKSPRSQTANWPKAPKDDPKDTVAAEKTDGTVPDLSKP